jgi:hypothetical protein
MAVDFPTMVCLSQSMTFCKERKTEEPLETKTDRIWYRLWHVAQWHSLMCKTLHTRCKRPSTNHTVLISRNWSILLNEGFALESLFSTGSGIIFKYIRLQRLRSRSRCFAYQLKFFIRTQSMIRPFRYELAWPIDDKRKNGRTASASNS